MFVTVYCIVCVLYVCVSVLCVLYVCDCVLCLLYVCDCVLYEFVRVGAKVGSRA